MCPLTNHQLRLGRLFNNGRWRTSGSSGTTVNPTCADRKGCTSPYIQWIEKESVRPLPPAITAWLRLRGPSGRTHRLEIFSRSGVGAPVGGETQEQKRTIAEVVSDQGFGSSWSGSTIREFVTARLASGAARRFTPVPVAFSWPWSRVAQSSHGTCSGALSREDCSKQPITSWERSDSLEPNQIHPAT